MSTNQRRNRGDVLSLAVKSGVVSGDPVVCGQLPGVAETSRDSNGRATVNTRGVYAVSVKGVDGGGNSAVAAGDKLYYVDGDTPPVSKKATGVYFGTAVDTDPPGTGATPTNLIASGSTATIQVRIGG